MTGSTSSSASEYAGKVEGSHLKIRSILGTATVIVALAVVSFAAFHVGAADAAAVVHGNGLDVASLVGLAALSTLTENLHAGAAIVSEAEGYRSRDTVTILSGQNLKANAVLGRTLTGGAAVATAFAGNTGNGAMGAIVVSGRAKVGNYKLLVIEPGTNLGTFEVEGPDGIIIGRGVVGTAFSAGGLAFTLADGAVVFVAGDGFDIAVTGTYKFKEYNPANADGSEKAAGVLYADVDASAADKAGVALVRDAEVHAGSLVWFAGATANQKTTGQTDLAVLGIIARS